jgi:glycosyltransferase involved in cell wall biosynthesis
MERPCKVALINEGYPPYMSGGIDIQTYDLAHALSLQGVDVTVFCGGADSPRLMGENERLCVFRLPSINIPPRVVWFQLQNFKTLRKTLQDYDIIHTQHSSGSIYSRLKKGIGKPWIVSFHDHHLRRLMILFNVSLWNLSLKDIAYYSIGYPLFELLTRVELKNADHYIVCGKSGYSDYINFSKMLPTKATIIPNGIDLDKVRLIIERSKKCVNLAEKEPFIIFTCGRLYASKGIQYLIKAMPYVIKHFKHIKLKIFGRGPLYSYLQNLIRSLKLESNVSLEGHVQYDRLIAEMNNCDLAVFPSLIEVGASLAVMEAMACHKPVIAFKYPFSMEVIEHLKTGYHVPPKDVEALANAICVLVADEALRRKIGENAYQNIVKNHDIKHVVKKYLEVYSNVLSVRN